MSTRVLISDASVSFAVSLAGALRGRDASVAILSGQVSDSPLEISWNRPSPLSARTVMLDIKNRASGLDCAVLTFDPSSIPQSCRDGSQTAMVRLVDEYVRGYLLLSAEIASAFRNQDKGLFCFALMDTSAPADAPGSVRDIAVSVAEGAFVRLAEETAATCAASDSAVRTLLAKLDPAEEAENLEWMMSQILNPSAFRKENRWVKPGARGLFGKR